MEHTRSIDEYIEQQLAEQRRESLKNHAHPHKLGARVQQVAAHAYIRMTGLWQFSTRDAEEFLGVSSNTFAAWKVDDTRSLNAEALEKISCLLGMYKHLGTLYSGQIPRVDRWWHCKNAGEPFHGTAPLKYLARSNAHRFYKVLRLLAAATV